MGARLFVPKTAAAGPALPPSSPARPSGRPREIAALLLVAGGAFLVLALLSCRFGPGMSDGDVSWVGPTGGFVARILVQGFGIAAWLAPLELSLLAIPLFRGRPVGDLGLRLAGDLTLLVVAAALVQVALPGATAFGHAAASGNVGLLFGELMRELFSSAGSFLVGLTIVGLILIGRSSFSFIEACHRLLALLETVAARLSVWSRRLGGAWLEARALRRAERERAPRIETPDPDAAILMQLTDDDDDWIPMQNTGAPPLAISQALRNARAPELGLVFATPEAPLVARLAAEPEPSAVATPPAMPGTAKGKAGGSKRRAKDGEGSAAKEASKTPPAVSPKPGATAKKVEAAAAPAAAASASPGEEAAAKGAGAASGADTAGGLRIVDTQPEREVEKPVAQRTVPKRGEFQLPAVTLFDPPSDTTVEIDREAIFENARRLEKTLADYGVTGKVEEVRPGPTVTMYEVAFEAGTRVSKVASLADDLALGLSRKVRIIAPIPGKSLIGFELPNDERQPVCLRELIEDQRFEKLCERAPLPVVLGRDIVGAPYYADLASMPHVIVAGATGAGKSVGLNVMLSSLLLKRTPDDLRLLMIDPKVVELAPFDGIPHLLLPVVTDMKQASTVLRWAVEEMERRYQLFADAGTKNITTYNAWVKRVQDGELPAPMPTEVEALTADGALLTVPAAKEGGDGRPLPGKLPYIVIVVDEFADLMMQQGKDVEAAVARLAQKARAAGMHVVLATQRPSVDVITGTIKANFPSRIAFRVAQRVDSRTILDEQGAELLLGRGDMLVKLNGATDTLRAQCPFVSEEEVTRLTDHLRKQGKPQYHEAILLASDDEGADGGEEEDLDSRFDEAVRIVSETQRCSTSWLQRKMTIGYNRAAKIVETMERRGLVGPPNGSRDRDVLVPPP
ncbi:MAG TPA: DNA translocase FtsK 4TM domain-containing protein [Polyangiaceae bacterium]|nr:DNA translocase FtsK 4TM domain-containing protein [Polyangiaceae bacterium]